MRRGRVAWRDLGLPLRLALVLLAVLFVLSALRSSVVEWNDVPSASMRPTIRDGDRIVVARMAYDVRVPFLGWRLWRRGDPRHGDLVVYRDEAGGRAVKRVIGVPGDRIEVRDHRVVRNGLALTQASGFAGTDPSPGAGLHGEDGYQVLIPPTPFGSADHPPLTVPPGEFFVMGDNRAHSSDSRHSGTIPRERIVGRAGFVAFSRDAGGFRRDRFLLRLR
jgi:signal peptidase I